MIKSLVYGMALLFFTANISAKEKEVEVFHQSGKVNVVELQSRDASNVFSVNLGKSVKGRFFIYHEVVNGKHVINGNAEFRNLTPKNIFVAYYLTLKDSKGQLICSTNGDLQVGSGNNIHEFASALMPLPLTEFPKVDQYELVLYESAKPIGLK